MKTQIENNILIAEFLGEKEQPYNFPQHGTLRLNGDFKTEFFDNQLQFHKNWNWLMEVVEKIEKTEVVGQVFNIQIDRNKTHILYAPANYPNEKWFENLILKEGESKILNCYNAVVEFIKWYNKQELKETKDLFEFYEDQPENVKSILESYGSIEAMTYEELTGLQKNLETIGYTFDYELDAQPFNLRKI